MEGRKETRKEGGEQGRKGTRKETRKEGNKEKGGGKVFPYSRILTDKCRINHQYGQ